MQRWWSCIGVVLALLAATGAVSAQRVSEEAVNLEETFLEAEREMILGRDEKAMELYREVLRQDPDNAAAAYQTARLYMRQETYEKALPMARKAIAGDPGNIWFRELEADLFERMGQHEEAAEAYAALVDMAPDHALLYTRWAYQLVRTGQIKEAIEVYDKLEKQIGLTEEVIQRKHKLYLGLGERDKAARELHRLVDAYPSRIAFRHQLADFYERIGEAAKAKTAYEEILAIAPDDPEAKLALAGKPTDQTREELNVLAALRPVFRDPAAPIDLKVKRILPLIQQAADTGDGELTAALLELTTLLEEVHPGDAKGFAASADLLYFSGRRAEAREKYARALELDDTVYPVWEQYLYILAEQRDFPALEAAAGEALDVFPNKARVYYLGGLALQKRQKNDEALALLQPALLMTGGDTGLEAELQCLLGTVYEQQGEPERADEAFARALEHLPKAPPILTAYGLALARSGRQLDRARDMLRLASEASAAHPDLLHAKGWLQYRKKNYEQAERLLAKALERGAQNDPVLLDHYGDVQFRRSEPEKALMYWKKAREAGNASKLLEKKIADRQIYE